MKRTIAWCYRFINNCKASVAQDYNKKNVGCLAPHELKHALNIIIRYEQHKCFSDEIKALKANKIVKSKLDGLNPFLFDEPASRRRKAPACNASILTKAPYYFTKTFKYHALHY